MSVAMESSGSPAGITTISAEALRPSWSEVINQVAYGAGAITVTRRSAVVAVITHEGFGQWVERHDRVATREVMLAEGRAQVATILDEVSAGGVIYVKRRGQRRLAAFINADAFARAEDHDKRVISRGLGQTGAPPASAIQQVLESAGLDTSDAAVQRQLEEIRELAKQPESGP